VAKSIKVHDDTHRALKLLKAKKRTGSIDQVIREMIRASTGASVESVQPDTREGELTKYLKG
jgi:hypothetical protein